MRCLLIAVVAAFASLGVNATEVAESMPVPEVAAPVLVYDLAPPPTALATVAPSRAQGVSEIKADKPKIVQKSTPKKSILSRTARCQMALMVVKRPPASVSALVFDDQDVDGDSDDLDLQCFYGRPKLAKVYDQDREQAFEISEHAKLRLLMARTKAVEVHQLAWPADQDHAHEVLSDNVKLRLALARMKAVQAHQKKFS